MGIRETQLIGLPQKAKEFLVVNARLKELKTKNKLFKWNEREIEED